MELQNFTTSVNTPPILLFSWVDYVLFVLMLCVSTLIGIYYGCFGSKQSTTEEYLHGGKSMKTFPIAMSLTASHLSGITLLGIPAEVYLHGTQYWICPISAIILMSSIVYVYLPVFYKLQLVSGYEYLKIRFDHSIRTLASLLFILATLLYVPIVIYVPSLAFTQVSGIELYQICPVICLVCIFYTTLGGLQAVVLSDTLQFIITLGTMITVIIMGTYSAGGFVAVWEKAASKDRIEFFNMNLNPTERTTFWTIVFGMTATWISNLGVNPSSIQRFLAVPSYEAAKRSVLIFGLATIVTKSFSCFTGLIMFAKYSDCDPISTGSIKRSDQLLPYYVLDVAGNLSGLPGLFIAGVFSTALSTMSTSINTLAGTIYEDFIRSRMPTDTSEKTASNIMKLIAVITGLISVALVFIVEKLGGVLEVSLSLHGITAGPLLGLFTLGMLFPSANTKGALYGGVGSTILTSILVGGAQFYSVKGNIKHSNKPLSVEGCDNVTSIFDVFTTALPPEEASEKPYVIFLISFYFFTLIGALLVLIIGLPVSWMTENERDEPVNLDLISPVVYRFLPETRQSHDKLSMRYQTVEKALTNIVTVENEGEKVIMNGINKESKEDK
ncbi:hypothetical protein ILUMI_22869 [Ignelater luminosus]|uniref:Sodium-coupled monocarboxylate transporter 1 n=1 Tax=Ignelater luminosus TaxID=2038154 RepID=A0A8K0CBY7_IGNLU|nr:hypothetical protein ILUMI_22869 [Ignelater luminosus]